MPVIRLICIDVDGTLVGRSGLVAEAVWEAAAAARARGIRLAICTGRPGLGLALEWASRLDAHGWHVFQNGASVLNPATRESKSTPLPGASLAVLIDRARATGRVLEVYGDTDYAVESDSQRSREHAALLGLEFNPRSFESLAQPPVRAQWLIPHHELATVLAQSHPLLDAIPSTSPVMPDTMFVNLTAAGVGKDSGVRTVATAYGIDLAEVMMVGDALNDLSAMHAVGFAVAMGNAEPELHAMARLVVGDVEDNGLLQAFAAAMDDA